MAEVKLLEFAKKPAVLAVGAVIGIGILIMASRGGSAPANNGDAGLLQSQAIASGTNVQLSGQATQYNIAGLEFQTALAHDAAAAHAADLNANTAITLRTFATLDNLNNNNNLQVQQRAGIAGSIALNDSNNKALLEAARIQASTAIAVAPIQANLAEHLAQISANTAIAVSNNNANIAQINAAGRVQLANTQSGAANDSALIKAVGSALPYLIAAF